jgi:hypothetical protein
MTCPKRCPHQKGRLTIAGAKLTDTQISKTKVKDKPYKLADGGGLPLSHADRGQVLARGLPFSGKAPVALGRGVLRYEPEGSPHRSPAPAGCPARGGNLAVKKRVSAVLAKLNRGRTVLAKPKPLDSSTEEVVRPANSFGAVQAEWFKKWSAKRAPNYVNQVGRRLDVDILPGLGTRPIVEIEVPDIVEMAIEIENRGAEELARKALWTTSQIFRSAIAKGNARRNPAADFKPGNVLKEHTVANHARVSNGDLPALLLAMENDTGTEITRAAIWIMARTFLRTTELLQAPWTEIDLDRGWWEIPKERMKMSSPHFVPLSRQVVAKLGALRGWRVYRHRPKAYASNR